MRIGRELRGELELATGEPDGGAADAHLPRPAVDDQLARLQDVRLPENRAPEQRPEPGAQLEIDVARHDIVRATLERADTHERVRPRLRQHDHRDVAVPRPSRLARAEPAAELGLADDHDVGRVALGEVERPAGHRPRGP